MFADLLGTADHRRDAGGPRRATCRRDRGGSAVACTLHMNALTCGQGFMFRLDR